MNELEMRAKELLVAIYEAEGVYIADAHERAANADSAVIRAIVAALSQQATINPGVVCTESIGGQQASAGDAYLQGIEDERISEGQAAGVPEGWVLVPSELIERFPEINPNNYGHDDACALNAWGVELVLAAAPKPEVGDGPVRL